MHENSACTEQSLSEGTAPEDRTRNPGEDRPKISDHAQDVEEQTAPPIDRVRPIRRRVPCSGFGAFARRREGDVVVFGVAWHHLRRRIGAGTAGGGLANDRQRRGVAVFPQRELLRSFLAPILVEVGGHRLCPRERSSNDEARLRNRKWAD